MRLTPPLKRLSTLSLMLSLSASPLYAQMTPLKADDGSKERRLQLPPDMENALRARDALESSQKKELSIEQERKAKENADIRQNRPKQSSLRTEKKKATETTIDKPVSEEIGLRPSLSNKNRLSTNVQNDVTRQNRELRQGVGEDNRQREALLDDTLPRNSRRIDINKATPTPSITSPRQGPSMEVMPTPSMAALANPRTGKLSPTMLQKQRDKVNSLAAREKTAAEGIKINQASQNRKILRSELVIIQRNSRYVPLPRALPEKSSATPIIVTRQNEKGRVLPNANPLAVGSITHPLSGVIIPRAVQKSEEIDLIGVFTKDNALLRASSLEDKIYQPIGIKSGAFTLMPSLDILAGYDSNFARNAKGGDSFLTTISPELALGSDFTRHAVNVDIKGSFSKYSAYQSAYRPELSTRVGVRLDIQRDQTLELDLRSRVGGQGTLPANYQLATDVFMTGEPLAYTHGAGATYTKEFNRLIFSLKGTLDRTTYDDVSLSDDSTIVGAERNFNAVRGAFRVAYRALEEFRPFVELFSEKRMFDVALRGSVEQGSRSYGAKAGVRFEKSKSLIGELALGTITRDNRDATQADVKGLLVDGTLVWMANGLTNVTFNAKTAFDESVLSGVSSIYRREVGVQIDHAFRRYLIASARFAYGNDIYEGSLRRDNRFNLTTALTYKLSRSVAVRGEYRFEKQVSSGSATGVDYTSNLFLVGLKLTR